MSLSTVTIGALNVVATGVSSESDITVVPTAAGIFTAHVTETALPTPAIASAITVMVTSSVSDTPLFVTVLRHTMSLSIVTVGALNVGLHDASGPSIAVAPVRRMVH